MSRRNTARLSAVQEIANEYGLGPAKIRELEEILTEWRAREEWIKRGRSDSGSRAKREISALAKTLNNLTQQWPAAFENVHLGPHLIYEYCGRPQENPSAADSDKHNRCLAKLVNIGREIDRLRTAVNAVHALSRWQSPLFGRGGSGRPAQKIFELLIADLVALTERMRLQSEAAYDFIEYILSTVLAIRFTSGTNTAVDRLSSHRLGSQPKVLARKTLKNIIARSRKSKPTVT